MSTLNVIKTIKVHDKNYGGDYNIVHNETWDSYSCRTPENCFGYENVIILDSHYKTAYALHRYCPNWILKKIEKILKAYSKE